MNINNKANNILDVLQFREATEQFISFLPDIANFTMEMYTEFKNKGFNDTQAFEFAKDYVLKLMFRGE